MKSGINAWSEESIKLSPDIKLIFSERRSLQNCNRYNNGTFAVNKKKEKRLKFLTEYYTISDEQRLFLGINTSEFLDECSFNNRRCSSIHLTNFSDLRYGNCISFNKKLKGEETLRISETGFGSGLILKFRLNLQYYLDTTHTLGAKVVIHDPKDSPDLEEEGYIIGPGSQISISLKQTVHQRLPAPYKDKCLDYSTQTNAYMTNRNNCIRSCIQIKNYDTCGCIDQTLETMNDLNRCNLTSKKEVCCLNGVLDSMSKHAYTCNCALPCSSIYYNELLSKSLLLPINQDSPEYVKFLFKYNYLTLNIFYSSLERHIYQQRPVWTVTDLLSCMGNNFGLWLGLSLVVLFEILEKFIVIIKHVLA
ncbi:acid-sensing ion channel 3 [Caerostris darwini]|uniref:Acid-sensing ion channel 3 n=1 Tax=Caerostris darwini TaxID=1538125 RepID=A0AAV4Q9V0_9ARAC|nr:acid-sensing ion channel 3 [Caerostris darwini]